MRSLYTEYLLMKSKKFAFTLIKTPGTICDKMASVIFLIFLEQT